MMTSHERSDLIHIMKMNRLTLNDSDTARLSFKGQIKEIDYEIILLAVEDQPTITIKKMEKTIYSETVKSIDDLKIFLEERLYQILEVHLSNAQPEEKPENAGADRRLGS